MAAKQTKELDESGLAFAHLAKTSGVYLCSSFSFRPSW
jgi:hypothetical protein